MILFITINRQRMRKQYFVGKISLLELCTHGCHGIASDSYFYYCFLLTVKVAFLSILSVLIAAYFIFV